jgi:hypothetical protein
MKTLAVLALCIAATAAHAEPRAWTAAKKSLPAGLQAVVGVNVAPIKSSALYSQLVDMAKSKTGADSGLDKVKTTCGFDASGIVDSAVMGMSTDDKAVVVIAIKGKTEAQLEACGSKLAKAEGKTFTATKDSGLVKYSGLGDGDAYVKWLSKDTFAMAENKDTLLAMTGGGVAKDSIGAQVAKLNTSAALWGVVNKSQDIPDLKGKMTSAYGTLDLKGGNLAANVHLVLDSAKTATDAATMGKQQLDGIKKSGQVPKQFEPLLNSITLKASGSELVCDGQASEADLASLMGMLSAFAR